MATFLGPEATNGLACHIVLGIDNKLLLMATFLGPEVMNGLALVNKDVYERLSDRMLCSAVVEGCFGRYGSNELMSTALQQKCLAKIEERGISGVLMTTNLLSMWRGWLEFLLLGCHITAEQVDSCCYY